MSIKDSFTFPDSVGEHVIDQLMSKDWVEIVDMWKTYV